jgi:hypothetical protein
MYKYAPPQKAFTELPAEFWAVELHSKDASHSWNGGRHVDAVYQLPEFKFQVKHH